MSNIEIRGVEYRKTGAGQAILNGANAWVTFDGGPIFYNTAQFPALVSAIPWPSAPAAPTDYFNAPELSQLNVEVGISLKISNYTGTSIGGYVRAEIVNRTTNTVLQTLDKLGSTFTTDPNQISTAVVLDGTINSNSPASLMYADNPYINVAAGDHIGIRVTNALTSPATITVGQFTATDGTTYYPLVRAFEWTYSTDPANTLPQTTTPNTPPSPLGVPAQIFAATGAAVVTRAGQDNSVLQGQIFALQQGDLIKISDTQARMLLLTQDQATQVVMSRQATQTAIFNAQVAVLVGQNELRNSMLTLAMQGAGDLWVRKIQTSQAINDINAQVQIQRLNTIAEAQAAEFQVVINDQDTMTVSVSTGSVTCLP